MSFVFVIREMNKEAGNKVSLDLVHAVKVDIIADVSPGIVADRNFLPLLLQLIGQPVQIDLRLDRLVQLHPVLDLLSLAFDPIIVGDPKIFHIIACALQIVNFPGPEPEVQV